MNYALKLQKIICQSRKDLLLNVLYFLNIASDVACKITHNAPTPCSIFSYCGIFHALLEIPKKLTHKMRYLFLESFKN